MVRGRETDRDTETETEIQRGRENENIVQIFLNRHEALLKDTDSLMSSSASFSALLNLKERQTLR